MRGTVVCFHRCFAAHLFQFLSLFLASMTVHSGRFSVRRQFRTAVRRVRRQRRMPVGRSGLSCLFGDYILRWPSFRNLRVPVLSQSPSAFCHGTDRFFLRNRTGRDRLSEWQPVCTRFFQNDGVCLKSVSALDGLIVSGMKKTEGAKKCTECAENLRIILV